MTSARDEVLGRIRAALADVPAGEPEADVPVPRDYRAATPMPPDELVALFVERVTHYDATVTRVDPQSPEAVAAAVAERLGATGVDGRVVVPADLPEQWIPAGADTVRDDGSLTSGELDACVAVVTGCRLAIADTGTVVLDAGAHQGRRLLTLIPDHHVCVVEADRIVASVPEAVRALDPRHPLTFVSGPSATVDIEFVRVGGVHGPRRLDVILVG